MSGSSSSESLLLGKEPRTEYGSVETSEGGDDITKQQNRVWFDDVSVGRRKLMHVLSVLAFFVLVAGIAVRCIHITTFPNPHPPPLPSPPSTDEGETPPTIANHHPHPSLLSVIDTIRSTPDTCLIAPFLSVMENPLYDDLRNNTPRDALSSSVSMQDSGTLLQLDKDQMLHPRESLTVSWSEMELPQADMESAVLALYCSSKIYDGPLLSSVQVHEFLEAATVTQALSTSHHNIDKEIKHGRVDEDISFLEGIRRQDSWYIPRFPVTIFDACQFVMYQRQLEVSLDPNSTSYHYTMVAASQELNMTTVAATPTNIHLAFGDDPTRMILQFSTGTSGTPVAMFGKSKPNTKVSGESLTYQASDMCGSPANVSQAGFFQSPGQLHTIELTDLEPNTRYAYKVGLASGQGIVWSQDQYSFTSNLAVGDDGESGDDNENKTGFSFIFYGDQGIDEAATWVSTAVSKDIATNPNIRSVHHVGDLSYAMGAGHVWDQWFAIISSAFSAKTPLMIGIGNHEYDHTEGGENGKDPSGVMTPGGFSPVWGNFGNDSGGECGIPTSRRFRMPYSSSISTKMGDQLPWDDTEEISRDTVQSNGVFWYSYDLGTVHAIVISSEHDLADGSPQRTWLEADLKRVNRILTPWLIVESHRPLYEGEPAWDQNTVGIGLRFEIEALLYDYRVDLVLSGHYHAYHRTCDGLFQSKCREGSGYNGPMHITVGSAGAKLDSYDSLYPNHWSEKFIPFQFGYSRITVANSTALHFEFIKVGAPKDSSNGDVLDDVWIRRDW